MPFPEDADPVRPTALDRLRVAFAVHEAKRIVDADGILDVGEIELLVLAFPNPWLRTCGFLDERTRLTPACEAAYHEALEVLPRSLSLEQKLELVTLFHRTCMVDGELHERELQLLLEAARRLGVPGPALREHLRKLRGAGPLAPAVRKGT